MSALYYTLSSLTTCGFGNIAPNTTPEKLFGCVTMLMGCKYEIFKGTLKGALQNIARYIVNKNTPARVSLIPEAQMISSCNESIKKVLNFIACYLTMEHHEAGLKKPVVS